MILRTLHRNFPAIPQFSQHAIAVAQEHPRETRPERVRMSPRQEGLSTKQVLLKLVFFSVLMWFIPSLLYGVTYFVDISENAQLYGYVSVLLVNLVIVLYVVQAFREKPNTDGAKDE